MTKSQMVEQLESRLMLAVITNGGAAGNAGYLSVDVSFGGVIGHGSGTGGLVLGNYADGQSILYEYRAFLEVPGAGTGGGTGGETATGSVFNLGAAEVIAAPTLVNANTVRSSGKIVVTAGTSTTVGGVTTVTGEKSISFTVTTTLLPGSFNIDTAYAFTSNGVDLRQVKFFQYCDTDIQGISDDLLQVEGSIANRTLSVVTIDPSTYIYTTQMNGPANAGGQLVGFAADTFPNLRSAINGGGFNAAAGGTINGRLAPGNFPFVGEGWGPGDITTALQYAMDSSNGNTISTRLNLFAAQDQALMRVYHNDRVVADGSTTRDAAMGTDFGTGLSPMTRYFSIRDRGLQPLELFGSPRVEIIGGGAGDFRVIRQPASRVNPGQQTLFAIQYVPSAAGLHRATVRIYSNDVSSTPYTFDIFAGSGTATQRDVYENDNTRDRAKVVSTDGVWKMHTLHRSDDVDWSVFTLTRASYVTIMTTAPVGDTRVLLTDANGNEIATDSDSGPGVNAMIKAYLPRGRYFIRVDEFGRNATVPLYGLAVLANTGGYASPAIDLRQSTGRLVINGTDIDDALSLRIYQTSLQVALNNDTVYMPLTEVRSITINTRGGNDTIFIGEGIRSASINAGSGDDSVRVSEDGNANVTVIGGAGYDTITTSSGRDLIEGGDDDDVIDAGGGNDTVNGGAGADLITGGAGNDTLVGGDDDDTLLGGAGNDVLDGGNGDDSLEGGDGDDTLAGGAGFDVMLGGAGANLFLSQDNEYDVVHWNSGTDRRVWDNNDDVSDDYFDDQVDNVLA